MQLLKLTWIFFLLYLQGSCFGQCRDIAGVSGGKGYVFLNASTDVLQASSLLSIDSVLQPQMLQKFVPLGIDKVLFVGYDPYYYWYRFTLCNNGPSSKNFVLLLGGMGIRQARIWSVEKNGRTLLGTSGYQYPFTSRPYPYVRQAFPLAVNAGATQTFYMQLDESHAYKSVSFMLVDPYKMKLLEHQFYLFSGLMIGLIFLFFIFNLFLYFSSREKIHCWYSLYLITILFFLVKNNGLDAEYLGLDSATGYRSTSMAAVANLAVGFLLRVVQLFLINLQQGWPNRALLLLERLSFIIAGAQFLSFYIQPDHTIEAFIFQLSNKTIIASMAAILLSCLYSYLKGYERALFILIAQTLFIAGAFARTLFLETDSYLFPPSLFELGLAAEVVIISYGLMHRYTQYKKDQEALKDTLARQQTGLSRQMVLTQEAEQKRIAEDLHDEIGGNLAAIKMTVQSFELPLHQLETLVQLIDHVSVSTRHIAHNLMPPEFEHTKLEDLLANYYQQLNMEASTLFRFYCSGNNHHFTKVDELMIYRIVMEITSNILKHANAAEATIQLVYHGESLALTAEDNGIGMPAGATNGMGLKNIRSRVGYMAGTIDVDSGKNGTTVIITFPYRK